MRKPGKALIFASLSHVKFPHTQYHVSQEKISVEYNFPRFIICRYVFLYVLNLALRWLTGRLFCCSLTLYLDFD